MQHAVVSHDEWLSARRNLLKAEKELTHLRDKIAGERLALPWVRIDKEYLFDTLDGPRALADLFEDRSQLLVQHFMFAPGWKEGCPSCSFMADHTDGMNLHLAHHDVTMVAVSRAPLAEIERYRERMGCAATIVTNRGQWYTMPGCFQRSSGGQRYNRARAKTQTAALTAPGAKARMLEIDVHFAEQLRRNPEPTLKCFG